MSLVNQKISNLLNGVSQRPATQRQPSQAVEQINGLSSLARGVMKRPPSQHVGQLTSVVTGWDDAFIHIINRDENERYHVVVANGAVQVFDAILGASIPVVAPGGSNYLVDSPGKGFRAVTVGDTTIIVNRGIKADRGTTKAAGFVKEALVYIRQADFSTLYTVTLNSVSAAIRTVDMDTPASRQGISTEAIATDLLTALTSDSTLNSQFVFTQYGATIHIARVDGRDFTLTTADGLSDNGLKAVKGSVQSFEDLPARAPNGFVVEVTGDIDTAKDNFFVKYDDIGLPAQQGVWRECPKPGTLLNLDASTLPHRLTLRGEVGVQDLAHEGLPPSIGTVTLYTPVPTSQAWGTYILTRPWPWLYLTEEHLGGASLVANQNSATLIVPYSIDISQLDRQFGEAYVRLYKNGVKVDEQLYRKNVIFDGPVTPPVEGIIFPGAYLTATGVATGDLIVIQLEYGEGSTPPSSFTAILSVAFPALHYTALGRRVEFTDDTFPVGATVKLLINIANDFDYVVTGSDQSAATVLTAMRALVDAHATYIAVADASPRAMIITRTDGALFTAALSATFPALTFHHKLMGLTPSGLVNRVIQNLTDGSSGVVTANTATTVTVGSLTGGSANSFVRGDICVVVVDPNLPTQFVFSPIPWKDRGAGDTDVVTFPSFIGSEISDVFFYQNRLGFLSKENIVFSSSGDLFNLFRYTATDLRPDDAIDVRSAHADVTIFDGVFQWSGGLYVKSDVVWFRVSGEPALTPTTIRLDPVGKYPSSKDPRPVVVGERVYFTRAKSGNTQVFELTLSQDGETAQAVDITKELPTYILGSPLEMVGDAAEGFLALLTDTGSQRFLYIYSTLMQGDEKVISSWSRWEFPTGTRIVGLDMADGVLGLVRKHADGAYLEQIDLDLMTGAEEKIAQLDRRKAGLVGVYAAGTTTWTLPYSVATDGSEGAVSVTNRTTKAVYTVTRPTATTVAVSGQGDLSAASVYVGVKYTFSIIPTQFFIRGQSGMPETAGRLQIRWIELFYTESTDFTVTVSPTGRTAVTYVFTSAAPASGSIRIPILCKNDEVTITITNATPGSCALSEIDWEGWFTSRGRRI